MYDERKNLDRHFDFLTRCKREMAVRSGNVLPRNGLERRQLAEGPRAAWADLDAFHEAFADA